MKIIGYSPDIARCVVGKVFFKKKPPGAFYSVPIETFGIPSAPMVISYRIHDETGKGWRYDLMRNAPKESMIWSRADRLQ